MKKYIYVFQVNMTRTDDSTNTEKDETMKSIQRASQRARKKIN